MNRLPLILVFLLLTGVFNAAADPLSWLNDVRRGAGVRPVQEDLLLSQTAVLWAARCAAAGRLSHKGDDGSTALDRYRALGGTEVRVGEILGAGPDLVSVERGWLASNEHRVLALSPGWTHAGWGSAPAGTSKVTVVVFTEKLVDRLLISEDNGTLHVTGRFLPTGAARGLLWNGLEQVGTSDWEPEGRTFRFEVPAGLIAGVSAPGLCHQRRAIHPDERLYMASRNGIPRRARPFLTTCSIPLTRAIRETTRSWSSLRSTGWSW